MSSDSSPCQELSRRLDVAALDYISAVPFMDNEFFELIRALEQPRLWQGAKEAIDSVVRLPDGKMCKEPDVALECVLTSQAYRTLAEQSVEKGLARLGANYFNDAISQGSDYLPGRYVAIKQCSIDVITLWGRDYSIATKNYECNLMKRLGKQCRSAHKYHHAARVSCNSLHCKSGHSPHPSSID